jgi:hypothetical protein
MKAALERSAAHNPLSARELTIFIGRDTCKHNVADL